MAPTDKIVEVAPRMLRSCIQSNRAACTNSAQCGFITDSAMGIFRVKFAYVLSRSMFSRYRNNRSKPEAFVLRAPSSVGFIRVDKTWRRPLSG
jgi:hypothetical protein